VLNKSAENTVFKRYNIAVVVTFIIIVFIALAASSLRYYSELSEHKQQGIKQLSAQAAQINSMLLQSEQAISGIQEFAQYFLKYPNSLYSKLPPLRQDGSLFFLDKPAHSSFKDEKRISGNITGFGNVDNFSLLKKQEIAMANALTPAFVTAQKVLEEANWFYYVSVEQFVNIFPWIGRDSWRFSDRMLTNAHAKEIQKLGFENNQVIWSSPYIDAAGTGMNFSLGIGVYRNTEMLGAVIIDISLARLQKSLVGLSSDDQTLVLFNQSNDILIFKQKDKDPLRYRASWQKLLPDGLHHLNQKSLALLSESTQIGDWLVEKQTLSINGWTLLKYQPYASFISPVREHFIFMFTILLIGLLAFLMLVNSMTRRSFIKPTHDFISHIEYCAQGDPGKVKANADWLHWFVLVEDIFTQNRSLLLQLKEQNEVLDSRVLEKTKALQETSAKHQRDYVLLRSVMNAIPELIIFNDPNGNLMGCNQAFEQLSGQSEGKMLGFKASKFMSKLLANEIEHLNSDFDHRYPQQALIEAGDDIYQGYCNQFTNEKNEVLGTITILQNVTQQQATQSALENAKNQAEYANKVKIQFLANMSHEIRTPINAIQGMMSLLTRTKVDSQQQHYLANAQTAALSLLHLIDELLDLSKIEAGKMIIQKEVIDLPTVIDSALKLNSANLFTKKIPMRVELAANIPRFLMSDEMRLVQVLSNLLNNAIKFTEQGEVALLIDSVGMSDTNVLVRFRVKDTGIGISKDNQDHLFKAFSQADISMTRKYGGSGLGLSICQQIVKLLGGEITLKSDLGEGCEFSFILPFSLPNEDAITNSAFHHTLMNDVPNVHIYGVKQTLSPNFIEVVKVLSWQYSQFDNLVELNNELSNKNSANEGASENKVVVLISEDALSQHELDADNFEFIDLIGLCQPTMKEVSSSICQQLDEMNVSYILLDIPLYRYSLEKIKEHLLKASNIKHNFALVGGSENIDEKSVAVNKKTNLNENLSNLNVLLVEDNLVNQLVAKELLISLNAKVVIAENGQKALDYLDENIVDVVLMDIQMPIMDGLTATEEIRKNTRYKDLPIIAMTAHAREEDKIRSIEAGMNLHIAKPVTAELLLTSIQNVLKNLS
jgi:PAS domain S-box-containing protein